MAKYFKVTNGSKEQIYDKSANHHRGMLIGKRKGSTVYSSARDIGNFVAGYIVGRYGYIT